MREKTKEKIIIWGTVLGIWIFLYLFVCWMLGNNPIDPF